MRDDNECYAKDKNQKKPSDLRNRFLIIIVGILLINFFFDKLFFDYFVKIKKIICYTHTYIYFDRKNVYPKLISITKCISKKD